MKFIVSNTALLQNLQLLNGVISTNTVLPILEDFLFVIEGSKLTIYATDLETSMSTNLEVEAKEDGRVAIPARILLETCKNLPDQPLTISIDKDNYAIEITTMNGKYKLAGENGDEFPRIPVAEDVKKVTIAGSILQHAITYTLFAVSNDELRAAMTGVFVELGTDGVTFVATDAHKLVKYKRTDVQAEQNASFILPKKALNLLKASIPEDEQVKIAYNLSNAFFSFGKVSLICRLIDAKYPDYNNVIPTENPNKLTLTKKDFQNSLKRIAIYANKTTHQVILRITGSELQVSAQDLDFSNEANEKLNCLYEGEDMEIGFNAKFLLEMMNVIDSNEVKIDMSSPTRAGLLFPTEHDENENITMLVMPVMLST